MDGCVVDRGIVCWGVVDGNKVVGCVMDGGSMDR